MNVEGKVVLITGAAGGLGHVVAERFARSGARLVLVDHSSDYLNERCADLRDGFDASLIGNVDVTSRRSVEALVETILAQHGRIDVLLNIVGGWSGGQPLWETDDETFDRMMNLNARSVFLMASAAAPVMIGQGSGKIVNIAAKPGLEAGATNGAYSASKSAVIRLTESLADGLKAHGINVNCVLPSIIDTQPNRDAMPKADFSKWVSPDALADVLLFLSSDAARAIHGAAIPVYGRV
nr:SDR family oxidoreductase [Anaerolineae bacterium]